MVLFSFPVVLIGVLCIAAILWLLITYNLFVVLRNRCTNSRAQIDIQLKRRYDLVPKLVRAVREYSRHEQETFHRVTEARTRAIDASSITEQSEAESSLSGALKSLFAVAEGYPDLKADQNFLKFQDELIETEDKIRFARQFYNDTVMRFNTTRETFPNIMLAKLFRFREEAFFNPDKTPS
ncbi:MAG: LemA family protein [Candidatus Krumholzibacteria bacterium]|nr:LemA family protein [Candidatus Krumholzibacteria bacterium]